MVVPISHLERGRGPLVAVALHAGDSVRDEVGRLLAVDAVERRRWEERFTAEWTYCAPTRLVSLRSRFEIDLDRPRDSAVYRGPRDAWGLRVWRRHPSQEFLARSLAVYDAFYATARAHLDSLERRYGAFVIFDLHSLRNRVLFNRQTADESAIPVRIPTFGMDRGMWLPILDRFIHGLATYNLSTGRLDIRETPTARSGYFARWVRETYPRTACVITVEFAKFFVDPETGKPHSSLVTAVREALRASAHGVLEELKGLGYTHGFGETARSA